MQLRPAAPVCSETEYGFSAVAPADELRAGEVGEPRSERLSTQASSGTKGCMLARTQSTGPRRPGQRWRASAPAQPEQLRRRGPGCSHWDDDHHRKGACRSSSCSSGRGGRTWSTTSGSLAPNFRKFFRASFKLGCWRHLGGQDPRTERRRLPTSKRDTARRCQAAAAEASSTRSMDTRSGQ